MSTSKVKGKVAVVTGASKGIGASIAKHLAAGGAAVVVNYVSSRESANHIVAEITKAGGRAIAVQADVSKRTEIERLFAETKQAFGSIINISSAASTMPPPGSSVYSATKAAVDAVTKTLARELGPRNIRVNAINPGMVETEGVHAAGFLESDFSQAGGSADSAWPHRTAAGYRARRRLPRLLGGCMDHWRDAAHRWRSLLIERKVTTRDVTSPVTGAQIVTSSERVNRV